jgi:hypothetical protein
MSSLEDKDRAQPAIHTRLEFTAKEKLIEVIVRLAAGRFAIRGARAFGLLLFFQTGVAPGAVQGIAPNQMRGQVSAL